MKRSNLTIGEISDRLQAARVQPTAQRLAIARYVLCEAEHPTAEDVKRWADKNFPKMSLATVYNTLGILVRGGLLKQVKLPHTEKAVYDDNVSEHYHFLDEKTGDLFDIDPKKVDVKARLGKNFQIKNVEVLLKGTVS